MIFRSNKRGGIPRRALAAIQKLSCFQETGVGGGLWGITFAAPPSATSINQRFKCMMQRDVV